MAELTPQGDKLGDLFPVRVTELTRVANIRDSIELLYYGNLSGHSLTAGQEDQIPTQSIAGQFRDLSLGKLDKTNGVALGNFTISNGTSPFMWLQGTTYKFVITGTPSGSDKTITLQNASGTLAFTSETQFAGLISVDSRTDSHTLNLGWGNVAAGNTKVVNVGTGSGSAGSTTVNIGASAGTSRLVNIYGSTQISGNLAMNSNKITGLAAGSAAGDAVRYEQLQDAASRFTAGSINTTAAIHGAVITPPAGKVLSRVVVSVSGTSIFFLAANGYQQVVVGAEIQTPATGAVNILRQGVGSGASTTALTIYVDYVAYFV